jgi:hypothetical protein
MEAVVCSQESAETVETGLYAHVYYMRLDKRCGRSASREPGLICVSEHLRTTSRSPFLLRCGVRCDGSYRPRRTNRHFRLDQKRGAGHVTLQYAFPRACRWETSESHHRYSLSLGLFVSSYPVPFHVFLSIRGVFYQRPSWGTVMRPVHCPSVPSSIPPSEMVRAIDLDVLDVPDWDRNTRLLRWHAGIPLLLPCPAIHYALLAIHYAEAPNTASCA